MFRSLAVISIALGWITSASATQQSTPIYRVSDWPQGISELPCSAFQKGVRGWTLVPTTEFANGPTLTRVTFASTTPVFQLIEAKCGPK